MLSDDSLWYCVKSGVVGGELKVNSSISIGGDVGEVSVVVKENENFWRPQFGGGDRGWLLLRS